MDAVRRFKVPAVTQFDPDASRYRRGQRRVAIQVSARSRAAGRQSADGTLAFFATGIERKRHDPLPPEMEGDRPSPGIQCSTTTTICSGTPSRRNEKPTLKAGPNSPVGVTDRRHLEHYGIHGTPEPGNLGIPRSHGWGG